MSFIDSIYEHLMSQKENKSLLKKYFKPEIITKCMDEITPTYESNLGHCSFVGVSCNDCVIGINAPDPEAYTVMAPLFNAVIKDYHKLKPKEEIEHPPSFFGSGSDLDCSNLDPGGEYIVSSRVQINRCIQGYVFGNRLTPEIRIELETKSKDALCHLTGDLAGSYHPITSLGKEVRDELGKDHMLFDENDKYLETNGVYRDWPNNRGMFINTSKNFVVWVNSADHLRIISTQKGKNIGAAFTQAVNAITILNRNLSFVKDDKLGYLTYCLSNVGTGLHAIFHVKIPHLAAKKNFNAICDKLNLTAESFQKVPIEGFDVVYAISNKRTIGLTENDIMRETILGVQKLIDMEIAAAEGRDKTGCAVS